MICCISGDFRKTLLRYIQADNLPVYLGGTLQDEDGNGRCPSKVIYSYLFLSVRKNVCSWNPILLLSSR